MGLRNHLEENKVFLAKENHNIGEWYDNLEELLMDLSLEYGKKESVVANYIDVAWTTGEIQRLHKGIDY